MKSFGTLRRFLGLIRLIRASEKPIEIGVYALFTAMALIIRLERCTTDKKT
jgi:hypothetical protein